MATCLTCDGLIDPAREKRRAKYCSDDCRRVDERARYRQANERLTTGLARGTVGALAELAVAVDLMERGHEVFRALSPACSCDLAVIVDGELVRVEVRSAHRGTNGHLYFGRATRDQGRHDCYAVVLHSDPREILYFEADGHTPNVRFERTQSRRRRS